MRNDIKIYEKDEIQQGTAEWFKIRELKFTASKADVVATNGKGLETYVTDLLADYYSSQKFDEYADKYKSPAMQRGNDYEPMARMVYEFETGNTVREVGFVTVNDNKYIGASPDGIVTEKEKDEGLLEIKNHDDKKFITLQLTGEVDPKYIKQMQYQMWITGAKWCDYFGFNPNFKPNFYKQRFYPDLEMFNKFDVGTKCGIKMIENGLKALEGKLICQETEQKEEENEKITEYKMKVEGINQMSDFPF